MGDPKRQKKKYQGPGHPWQGDRISEELALLREYGLKNKKELWKVSSLLRNWRGQARNINSLTGDDRLAAQKILIAKLHKLGLVNKDAQLDDVLALSVRDLLDRRLQTIVYKDGMANSVLQARQFITHNKVTVNGQTIPSPSQLLRTNDKVAFAGGFKPVVKKTVKLEKEAKAIEKEMERVLPNRAKAEEATAAPAASK